MRIANLRIMNGDYARDILSGILGLVRLFHAEYLGYENTF